MWIKPEILAIDWACRYWSVGFASELGLKTMPLIQPPPNCILYPEYSELHKPLELPVLESAPIGLLLSNPGMIHYSFF